jgi:hypothetical protein
MYIIAIAWIYVTFLMAATEASITAGVLTFVFYGLVPCGLLMWILGAPQRKRKQQELLQDELSQPDGTDAKTD